MGRSVKGSSYLSLYGCGGAQRTRPSLSGAAVVVIAAPPSSSRARCQQARSSRSPAKPSRMLSVRYRRRSRSPAQTSPAQRNTNNINQTKEIKNMVRAFIMVRFISFKNMIYSISKCSFVNLGLI